MQVSLNLTALGLCLVLPLSAGAQQKILPSKEEVAKKLKEGSELVEKVAEGLATKDEKKPAKPKEFAELEAKVLSLQQSVTKATASLNESNKKSHQDRIKEFETLIAMVNNSLKSVKEGGDLQNEIQNRKTKTEETLKKFRAKSVDGSLDAQTRETYKRLELRAEAQLNAMVDTSIGMMDFAKLLSLKVKYLEGQKGLLADVLEINELEEINKALTDVVNNMKEVDSGFDKFMKDLTPKEIPLP